MITLKTLDQATAQEVFDQVKNHLLSQMEKSVIRENTDENCSYRSISPTTNKVLKCAAGCLIADDEYNKDMDTLDLRIGNSWKSVIERYKITKKHMDLIISLQTIHDNSDVPDWEFKLKQLASDYNLIY